ncbi:MAG: hypothetical protein ACR2JX_06900 [Mycobacteriales bacterium]
MSEIEVQVLEAFLERLRALGQVNDPVGNDLRIALSADPLPKADELVKFFTAGSGDELA